MEIRTAREDELEQILALYGRARDYMRSQGNLHQWVGGYPSRELVAADIRGGACRVCLLEGQLVGVFCYFPGPDPTYAAIDGGWLTDGPYGVIHRIAADAHRQGVASACFAYALARCPSLRIDTHRDNLPMQRALAKNGFTHCGTIYLENGDPRLAYEKRATD